MRPKIDLAAAMLKADYKPSTVNRDFSALAPATGGLNVSASHPKAFSALSWASRAQSRVFAALRTAHRVSLLVHSLNI